MRLAVALLALCPPTASAVGQLIPAPAGSASFGQRVVFLPNGNLVVTDPNWSDGPEGVGAVYLYDATGTLISRLRGSRQNDFVGSGGVTVLSNGNFVVSSPDWDPADGVENAGAMTFGDADTGFGADAAVDATNSLVGSSDEDRLGSGGILPLPNGNYVVASEYWDNGAALDAGAVTWGDGGSGTLGEVGPDNSFVGSTKADYLGTEVTVLTNGNYVVGSQFWDDGNKTDVGLVAWRPGTAAAPGVANASNSVVGTTPLDRIGSKGIVALANGNYVVASPLWNNNGIVLAGAVQWRNGSVQGAGPLLAAEAIVGTTMGDQVGSGGVRALANGHYAFASPLWDRGALANAGAVRWADGTKATTGTLSATNSLVGASVGDQLGSGALFALQNGNFVALSPLFDGPSANSGAATLMPGNGKLVGSIDLADSVVGFAVGDFQFASVVALAKNNFVVVTPYADVDGVTDAGAVTWCPGASTCQKTIGTAAPLVGSSENDHIGYPRVVALTDGNFVVASQASNAPNVASAGALTWGDGLAGTTVGAVSDANSLVGSTLLDYVGTFATGALPDGGFFSASPLWDGPGAADMGALTLATTSKPGPGPVSSLNSVTGPAAGESLGQFMHSEVHGDWTIASFPSLDNGALEDAGAVVAFDLTRSHSGTIDLTDAVRGDAKNGGIGMNFDVDSENERLAVGDPAARRVHLVELAALSSGPALLRDGFED